MKMTNFRQVEDLTEGRKLPVGGYVAQILKVVDVPNEEYLNVAFEICEGEFKGYFSEQKKQWGGEFRGIKRVYYTEKSLGFFKAFITSIEESNNGFMFDGTSELTLQNKFVGIVFGEEEYEKDGQIKVSVKPMQWRSVEKIRTKQYVLPKKKELKQNQNNFANPTNFSNQMANDPFSNNGQKIDVSEDDLPF